MAEKLAHASISVICVVNDRCPHAADFSKLLESLVPTFADADIVITANGCSDETALALKSLTEQVSDITVEFLARRIDRDSATLVGMENAVGDWVLLIEPTPELVVALPRMFMQAAKGADVVLGLPVKEKQPMQLRALLLQCFVVFYNWLNRASVMPERPVASLFSRPAALHILHSADGEMLLRSRRIATGFPATELTLPVPTLQRSPLSAATSVAKGVGLLLSSSTTPLRFVSLCGFLGGGIALLNSLYVVLVYLLKEEVQPGWTTMSLQLSFLTFFCSMMFALLAEYIVQIHAASNTRRRHFVSREIRSQRFHATGRLNVVGGAGHFRIGGQDETFSDPAAPSIKE